VALVLRVGVTLTDGVRVFRDPDTEIDNVVDAVMASDTDVVTLSDCVRVMLAVTVSEPETDNCCVVDSVTESVTDIEDDDVTEADT
jgi:hypothetical protein